MKVLASEIDLMARTVFGEARGESFHDKLAVSHVILNRVRTRHRREHTIAGVVTEPYQFSAWNENDPNREVIWRASPDNPAFRECMVAVLMALREDATDPTNGSCFYHTKAIKPDWAEGHIPAYETANHLYYNTVR